MLSKFLLFYRVKGRILANFLLEIIPILFEESYPWNIQDFAFLASNCKIILILLLWSKFSLDV